MALPSEPAPDFPLVAQAPSSFSLPHTDSFSSTPHTRGHSDSSELNLSTNQDFSSPIDRNVVSEGAVAGLRASVMSEATALPTHLSSSIALNSLSATRNLGGTLGGLPPLGSSLPVSSHTGVSNPLSSSNPLPSFLPNPTSLSSLSSIGSSVTSLPQSGLRLQDGAASLSQHSHAPQLPPLPPHLSSFPFPFAVSSQLQSSSSLGMGGQHQQQHTRAQSMSHGTQNLVVATSAPPSTQHQLQQHTLHPNMAPTQGLQQPPQSLSSSSNMPGGGMPPMPLSHNMAGAGGLSGSLSNPPAALPLLPGMHNMYPYPYTGALPSATAVQSLPNQPITSAVVRMNTPGFPSQTLVPGYPSYIAPSLYGNTQPPVTNTTFTR